MQGASDTKGHREFPHRCGSRAAAGHTRARSAIVVQVEHLKVSFGSVVALRDVTVGVPAGLLTMIVGPPGCGKTALLKSLSCELPWGAGSISIQDVPARLWPSKKRGACVCTCPAQRGGICPYPSPLLCADSQAGAFETAERSEQGSEEAFRLLGIEHLASRPIASMNDRDRCRFELAWTLAPFLSDADSRAIHLWLDDPLDAIDGLRQHRLLRWLKETSYTRQTTVVTAMDHTLARAYADHAILLCQGSLVAEGSPGLALSPRNLTRAFAGCQLEI